MKKMFENPKNTAIFDLTTRGVVGDNTDVKPIGSIIRSNRILPGRRADLRDREVRTAPIGPHKSAHVPGCFFAQTAQEAGLL